MLKYQREQNEISTDPFKLLMETDERNSAWGNTWSFRLMEQRRYNEAVGPPGGHKRAMGNYASPNISWFVDEEGVCHLRAS